MSAALIDLCHLPPTIPMMTNTFAYGPCHHHTVLVRPMRPHSQPPYAVPCPLDAVPSWTAKTNVACVSPSPARPDLLQAPTPQSHRASLQTPHNFMPAPLQWGGSAVTATTAFSSHACLLAHPTTATSPLYKAPPSAPSPPLLRDSSAGFIPLMLPTVVWPCSRPKAGAGSVQAQVFVRGQWNAWHARRGTGNGFSLPRATVLMPHVPASLATWTQPRSASGSVPHARPPLCHVRAKICAPNKAPCLAAAGGAGRSRPHAYAARSSALAEAAPLGSSVRAQIGAPRDAPCLAAAGGAGRSRPHAYAARSSEPEKAAPPTSASRKRRVDLSGPLAAQLRCVSAPQCRHISGTAAGVRNTARRLYFRPEQLIYTNSKAEGLSALREHDRVTVVAELDAAAKAAATAKESLVVETAAAAAAAAASTPPAEPGGSVPLSPARRASGVALSGDSTLPVAASRGCSIAGAQAAAHGDRDGRACNLAELITYPMRVELADRTGDSQQLRTAPQRSVLGETIPSIDWLETGEPNCFHPETSASVDPHVDDLHGGAAQVCERDACGEGPLAGGAHGATDAASQQRAHTGGVLAAEGEARTDDASSGGWFSMLDFGDEENPFAGDSGKQYLDEYHASEVVPCDGSAGVGSGGRSGSCGGWLEGSEEAAPKRQL